MRSLLQMPANFSSSIWKLVRSEKSITARLTNSGQVFSGPCLLLECGGAYVTESEYVSPTSHLDVDTVWDVETNVYDEDTGTAGSTSCAGTSWSGFLELLIANLIYASGIRFFSLYNSPGQMLVDFDYWNGRAWVNVYEGGYYGMEWNTLNLPALFQLNRIRLRFRNNAGAPFIQRLYEVDFIRRKVLDVSFYDGHNSRGDKKHRLVLSQTGNRFNRFIVPIYFSEGIYVNFAESVGECFIRYIPMELEP